MKTFKDFLAESRFDIVKYFDELNWVPNMYDDKDAAFMITSALEEPGTEKWVSLDDDTIVAAAAFEIKKNTMEIAYFGSVMKGAGSPLMEKVIHIAMDRGCKRIELTSTIQGDNFYLKHGFKMMDENDQNSLVYMVKYL